MKSLCFLIGGPGRSDHTLSKALSIIKENPEFLRFKEESPLDKIFDKTTGHFVFEDDPQETEPQDALNQETPDAK